MSLFVSFCLLSFSSLFPSSLSPPPYTSLHLPQVDANWIPLLPKSRMEPGMLLPISPPSNSSLSLLAITPPPLVLEKAPSSKSLYVVDNRCPHLGTPLETGKLTAETTTRSGSKTSKESKRPCITCPLHRTTFDLESGDVVGDWVPYPPVLGKLIYGGDLEKKLPTYRVREKGKMLEVRVEGKEGEQPAAMDKWVLGENGKKKKEKG